MRKVIISLLALLVVSLGFASEKKTVYLTFVLHGNMNYDRYVRPTIWEDFPKIYDNLLTYMDEHPDFKGQVQFSGQTFGSLQQCAPQVIEHALSLNRKGQLNFTGTFYSEPVNVNMDGETNYRCAWLGTKIIEDAVGSTDGFYLQERAYHSQLPWILKNSNVSWTPVITGNDDDFFPFKLVGMDGSETVGIPTSPKYGPLLDKILRAPKNALLLIEEDYEIPSSFVKTYEMVKKFESEHPDITVRWTTAKDYIRKFGVRQARYLDHAAKVAARDAGTYSRWTADPLDIIVQDHTNRAMADRRSAEILSAFVKAADGYDADVEFDGSGVELEYDPLAWNIERADLYPGIEPRYLARDGKVTLLSKAEHLLLWAVNSDAKGWYPLYEKRRERINSFENSSLLSREVIYDALDHVAGNVKLSGYDRYYILANMEQPREAVVTVETPYPCEFFDCRNGEKLQSGTTGSGGVYRTEVKVKLPSYGYVTIGANKVPRKAAPAWKAGTGIESGSMSVRWNGSVVELMSGGDRYELSMDDFKIRSLAETEKGKGDTVWRDAVPYGDVRVSVREDGISPQLRIDRQLDWLVHLQQLFTIEDGKLVCDYTYVFPHPTLVRREPLPLISFDPRGLTFNVNSGKPGKVFFDMPYGISGNKHEGDSYLCALSSCFVQNATGGLVVSPQTGEQAFYADPENGKMTLFMGASTTSGPIRDVGMVFETPTLVHHVTAWYSEPFHGEYRHRIVLAPYNGDWKESDVPSMIRAISSPVYVRECKAGNGNLPAGMSFAELDCANVDITYAHCGNGNLSLRLNENEGTDTEFRLKVCGHEKSGKIKSYGIINIER